MRAARRISRRRTRFLAGIGLSFALLAALGSAIQDFDGGEGRFTLPVALITGGAGSLLAYVVMTAATAEAMRRAAVGEEVRVNVVGRWSTWSPCPTSRWRSPSPTATASPGAWPRAATVALSPDAVVARARVGQPAPTGCLWSNTSPRTMPSAPIVNSRTWVAFLVERALRTVTERRTSCPSRRYSSSTTLSDR